MERAQEAICSTPSWHAAREKGLASDFGLC